MCVSLAGMLNPELGYFIVPRKGNFYSVRSKHDAPPDGHWRFIVLCAELAQNKLYISDIHVPNTELQGALLEANHFVAANSVYRDKPFYRARDIINLKTTFSL